MGLRRGEELSTADPASATLSTASTAPGALSTTAAASTTPSDEPPLTTAETLRQWWPLAAGWLLMTAELTVFTAIVARMAEPSIQLAAWGVVFAVSTLVQSPSTALLPTSTAMARDGQTFRQLSRYATFVITGLTLFHALVALTPLYNVVATGLMGVPEQVAAAARPALIIMLPWTFGTGTRRFLQGVMIRFGHARVVILGSLLRLGIGTVVMIIGSTFELLPGAQLAAAAIIVGVLSELIYNRLRFVAVIPQRLPARIEQATDLNVGRFFAFFMPLVLMTALAMVVQTLVTVVLGRMPLPLESLAVWPVLFSFIVILQSPGLAYTEVVISLLERRGAVRVLRRVTWIAVAAFTLFLVLIAATPASRAWFGTVAGLPPELVDLAVIGMWFGVMVPGLRLITNWYQGVIIHNERNRGILESVLVFFIAGAVVLVAGVVWSGVTGLYVGMVGMTVAMAAQAAWLAYRAAPLLRPSATEPAPLAGSQLR